MRPALGLLLGAFLILVVLAATAPAPRASAASSPTSWLVVGLRQPHDIGVGSLLFGGVVKGVSPAVSAVQVVAGDLAAARATALADPNVRYAEIDSIGDALPAYAPNDPYFSAKWEQPLLGFPQAWDATRGSPTVRIGLVDSGLNWSHPEVVNEPRYHPVYDFTNNDAMPEDDCGHGTAVTGTIAAQQNNQMGIPGIAQVEIDEYKVFRESGGSCLGSWWWIGQGIQQAATDGVPIEHLSVQGTSHSSFMNDSIKYAYGKGALLIGAAGNQGCYGCVTYPFADNPNETVVVTATDHDDNFLDWSDGRQWASNSGPGVDLSAPGIDIWSWYPSPSASATEYGSWEGTSFSTPQVTGLAALLKSVWPQATNKEIEARMEATAVDKGPAGWDAQDGWGRIDAAAAVLGFHGPGMVAQFPFVKGNTWWVQAHVDANAPPTSVDVRIDQSAWQHLSLQSWGDWAASIHVLPGSMLQFRASSPTGGASSACYTWPSTDAVVAPTPCPSSFAATFTGVSGNEWWIQTSVTATGGTLASVDASLNQGPWQPLTKQSWGGWAASYHAPAGTLVRLRAMDTTGATSLSGCYQWTGARAVTCPSSTPTPTATTTTSTSPTPFAATFTGVSGNEWWIQTSVSTSGGTLASVSTRLNGGAWQPLTKQSWGGWAASYHAPAGTVVQLEATSTTGTTRLSNCYHWTDATSVACPGTVTATPPPPTTTSTPTFSATFGHVAGNNYWEEVVVSASKPLAGVDVRVSCGATFTPMTYHADWAKWTASVNVPTGATVDFRARATDGSVAVSGAYTWTSATPTNGCP